MTDDRDNEPDKNQPSLPFPTETADERLYTLSERKVEEIEDLLHAGYTEQLVDTIADLSAADSAELLSQLNADDRRQLLEEHGAAFDPYTFAELPDSLHETAFDAMPPAQIAAILSEMDSDDALDMIVDLDSDLQKEIIQKLSAKMRVTLEEGLSFRKPPPGV